MCLAHSMAHSTLPDVTRASDSTARHPGHPGHPGHPQPVTEQPGKDQEISGTPQNTLGGMQQMEKKWVMDSYG